MYMFMGTRYVGHLPFCTDTLELYHNFPDRRIYNNSVINYFNEEDGFTSQPPLHKRNSPIQNSSLYVDCAASQGYNRPTWVTTNPLVGKVTGVISSVGEMYRAEMVSDYISRLSFERFEMAYSGVYMCLSETSSEFVEIVITNGIIMLCRYRD